MSGQREQNDLQRPRYGIGTKLTMKREKMMAFPLRGQMGKNEGNRIDQNLREKNNIFVTS